MTVNYTTNLSLGQPVTGTESGTWGDDVNNAVTSYLDIAIAGGLAVTVTTADVTLTITQGTSVATNIGSTTAQYAILNVSGAMTAARNLIVPSSSRIYLINNNTTGGFALTVKGSATSGVTMVNGEKAHVFWNGTDYAKMSNASGGAGVFSSITNSGLTSGRVVYSTTGGLETDSAGLTFDGTNFATTGTATATKLIPTGTSVTGNGMYLPAANSVGISTAGTNAVYIDASQNVGIGVTTPQEKLEVKTATSTQILVGAGSGFTYGIGRETVNGFLRFYGNQTTAVGYIFTGVDGERMRIDASGNVGIAVVPSAWSAIKAIQVGYAALGAFSTNLYATVNTFFNGTDWKYITTDFACRYQQSSGQHQWYTAPSGTAGATASFTQTMTLDNSGNVGIGTNSPATKLHVEGSLTLTGYGSVLASNSTTGISLLGGNQPNGANSGAQINLRGTVENRIEFIKSGNVESARIDSSGFLLIGYTSSNGSYKLQVNSQIFATSSTIATSDARYKENVEELSGALDIVKSLRPVSFDWKVHPIHNFDTKTKTVGFLAQDVQQTLAGKPYLNSIIKTNECVIEPEVKDKNGTVTKEAVTEEFLGIAEGNMISILTAAIKELKAEFDAQASTIQSLTARITALEAA